MIVTKFEEITRQVWNNIHYADMYQTLYREETLTDSILLELVKARNFHICILQTPKSLESIKGTDWEWFVGSYRLGWIRYAIQAKKISVQNNTYNNINHKVGVAPNQAYQMVILRRYSRVNGAIPIAKLPEQFVNALELGILEEFAKELFRQDIQIVPRRLAIITLVDGE